MRLMSMDPVGKESLFPPTRWSLVLRANGPHAMAGQVALGELLKSYWQPLYVFARRSGLGTEDAQDAVQSFCADVIRVESLKSADREQGRLRSFLLGGFQNHLRTLHRDAQRQKRGGGVQVISLDDAEAALDMQLVEGESPDRAFDRRWALTLLDHVLKRLRAEYVERGRGEVFEVLEPTLVWNQAGMSYDSLGERLGIAPAAVAQTVKRMRARYRTLLEQEIGDTVDGPEAMAEERDYLIRVLSGG
jgi:RNA polymerase sigma factor (sigma-70 family)